MSFTSKKTLALFLVYFIWGSTFLSIKVVLHHLPPLFISGTRFFVGGFFLLLFITLYLRKKPTKQEFINAFSMGILLTGIGNCSIAYAINYIDSGLVALISATIPIWIFIIDILFFNPRKPSIWAVVGLLLGLIGMIVLLKPDAKGESIAWFPAFISTLGAISWAYGSVKSLYLKMPESPIQSAAVQLFAGGCFGLLMSFFLEQNQVEALQKSPAEVYIGMLYLIVIGSYLGYLAYIWLINNVSTLLASTYAYINPIVALFLGWFFLGEKITSNTLIASALILVGVVFMAFAREKHD